MTIREAANAHGKGVLLGLVIPAFVFFGSALRGMYDDSVAGKQRTSDQAELRAQLIACRNRELDDVKARLLHMEHPAQ